MVPYKVQVGGDISFLEASVKESKAVPDEFGAELLFVVEISKDVGNFFEF